MKDAPTAVATEIRRCLHRPRRPRSPAHPSLPNSSRWPCALPPPDRSRWPPLPVVLGRTLPRL